jgi:hypothetical protein
MLFKIAQCPDWAKDLRGSLARRSRTVSPTPENHHRRSGK